ncbi:hypothetical protein EI94DRAFT_1798176 [Lactarius quietus]|nr:hypothetical protein EI94DRAFT_1798176 [Lactarius quietus]
MGETGTCISDRACNTHDTGPICKLKGPLAVGGVAGRSPSAGIVTVPSVGGLIPESRAIQVDWARLRRGGIVCSSFGRELWGTRFCVVAQHSTFLVTGSSGTGKSSWERVVASFRCKYHAIATVSLKRSSANRFGGACVIVVLLAVSQDSIFKLEVQVRQVSRGVWFRVLA